MGSPLPLIPRVDFERELQASAPQPLGGRTLEALWLHYEELRRWNPRLSLIGPGTAQEVVSRHYGEALAALPLLPSPPAGEAAEGSLQLLDIGSGGGFPGLVLAAAAPAFRVTLVEPRQRKAAFLQTVIRKTALPCTCLNGRVSLPLPEALPRTLDVLTLRALKLPRDVLDALGARCRPGARAFLWRGADEPDLPTGWRQIQEVPLVGSRQRRILALSIQSS